MRELPVSCPTMFKGRAEIRIAKIQDTFPQRHDNRRAAERVDPLFGCVVRVERLGWIDEKGTPKFSANLLKSAAPGLYLLLSRLLLIVLWNGIFQIFIQIEHCLKLINRTDLDVELFSSAK